MPCISQFFGMSIYIYYNDHAPPHFHVTYAEHEATILIDTLAIYSGALPRRARALALEWASLHREELAADWDLAQIGLPLNEISPLD
jgi:hypothetical protein